MKKNYFPIFLFFAILALAFVFTSCSDDENPIINPIRDTNVVRFDNLIIGERIPPFDTSSSGVDFYRGVIVKDNDPNKDATLVDELGMSVDFYFRSGAIADGLENYVIGYDTRFKRIFGYENFTQAQFDTITVIPDTDNELTGEEFTSDRTEVFRENDIPYRVHGFYLVGKYLAGVTPNKVFGILYIESAVNDPVRNQLRVTFDVKINKNGINSFREFIQ